LDSYIHKLVFAICEGRSSVVDSNRIIEFSFFNGKNRNDEMVEIFIVYPKKLIFAIKDSRCKTYLIFKNVIIFIFE